MEFELVYGTFSGETSETYDSFPEVYKACLELLKHNCYEYIKIYMIIDEEDCEIIFEWRNTDGLST
jgi:hypothetical protein